MTIDAAFAALVEANPIPDPSSYAEHRLAPAAFLTATRERTKDMQTIDQQESTQKTTQRRWQPLAAVAAFVLVIAVGVAAGLVLRGGDEATSVPAPPFDTPQEAVEAYVAAVNAGDGETYLSLFAQDASDGLLNGSGIASDATIKARVETLAAMEVVSSVAECVAETDSRARCAVMSDDPFLGITTGIREWEQSSVLTINESGLIQRIGISVPPQGTVDEARSAAHDTWMEENYPKLRNEFDSGIWGSDPIERPAGDIGREFLAASREFDAQYDG